MNYNLAQRYKQLREEYRFPDGSTLSTKGMSERTGIAASRISELEHAKRDMSFFELKTYHDFFKVSMEYLLGETDVRGDDADLQAACQITHLSEKAVKNIAGLNEERIKALNYFIESPKEEFEEFIDFLNKAIDFSIGRNVDESVKKVLDDEDRCMALDGGYNPEYADMLRTISNIYMEILNNEYHCFVYSLNSGNQWYYNFDSDKAEVNNLRIYQFFISFSKRIRHSLFPKESREVLKEKMMDYLNANKIFGIPEEEVDRFLKNIASYNQVQLQYKIPLN